ncbi:hypothetical protein LP7551_01754 [Roseibium album]|nr:hypothetical protein LP7551_01754 [Roseibium album]
MTDIMTLARRIAGINTKHFLADLEETGNAVLTGILTREECNTIASQYDEDTPFRSHVRMARHGVSKVRSGQRHTLGVIFHDAA